MTTTSVHNSIPRPRRWWFPLLNAGLSFALLMVLLPIHETTSGRIVIILLVMGAATVSVSGHLRLVRRQDHFLSALLRSEENFRSLYEDAPVGYQSLDASGNILMVNRAWLDSTGYQRNEVIGHPFVEFLAEDARKVFRAKFAELRSTRTGYSVEFDMTRQDGRTIRVNICALATFDDEDRFLRTHCIVHDITKLKQIEQALQKSQRKYKRLYDNALVGMFTSKIDGSGYVECNDRCAELFGYDSQEDFLATDPIGNFVDSRDRERLARILRSSGEITNMEALVKRRDGSPFWIRVWVRQSDESGLIEGVLVDNTEAKQAEEELVASKQRYQRLFKIANDALFVFQVDEHGRPSTFSETNEVASQWLGYSHDEFSRMGPDDIEVRSKSGDAARRRLLEKHEVQLETVFVAKNGRRLQVEVNAHEFEMDGCRTVLAIARDVSVRAARHKQMKLLSTAVNQSGNMVVITDPDGVIEYANPRFCEVTGYSFTEALNRSADTLQSGQHPPEFYEDFWDTIRSGKPWCGVFHNKRKNGELFWERETITPIFSDSGKIVNFLAVGEDITSEVMTRQQLAEADKMAAIGVLAAGVAHEFKNYLGGIVGNASFALDELAESDDLKLAIETLAQILDMADKANEVAMSLLTYSKAQPEAFSSQELKPIITNTISLVERELATRSIELTTFYDDVPQVEVSANKIQQLLLNLLINSEQAIASQGVITIALLREGDGVRLTVSDSGPGIPSENLPSIFDPFFSTKGVWGKDEVAGTGMGLSISRNIAREHGGDLTVESLQGLGTTFTLTLPLKHTEHGQHHNRAVPVHRLRALVFSMTSGLLRHYFPDACGLGVDVYTIDNVDRIHKDLQLITDLVICDAGFRGRVELLRVVEICREGRIPYIVVGAATRDYQMPELYKYARMVSESLPSLADILACLGQTEPGPVA